MHRHLPAASAVALAATFLFGCSKSEPEDVTPETPSVSTEAATDTMQTGAAAAQDTVQAGAAAVGDSAAAVGDSAAACYHRFDGGPRGPLDGLGRHRCRGFALEVAQARQQHRRHSPPELHRVRGVCVYTKVQ